MDPKFRIANKLVLANRMAHSKPMQEGYEKKLSLIENITVKTNKDIPEYSRFVKDDGSITTVDEVNIIKKQISAEKKREADKKYRLLRKERESKVLDERIKYLNDKNKEKATIRKQYRIKNEIK
jgi:hypothetical protein